MPDAEPSFEARREAALDEKERLGRSASYGTLADRTGYSKTTVQYVLKDRQTNLVPINREAVLSAVERELDSLSS